MTFGQIFVGRMVLMRAQRHIAQAGTVYLTQRDPARPFIPQFRGFDAEKAFFLVERLLVELEKEFEAKKATGNRSSMRSLERRANAQVTKGR